MKWKRLHSFVRRDFTSTYVIGASGLPHSQPPPFEKAPREWISDANRIFMTLHFTAIQSYPRLSNATTASYTPSTKKATSISCDPVADQTIHQSHLRLDLVGCTSTPSKKEVAHPPHRPFKRIQPLNLNDHQQLRRTSHALMNLTQTSCPEKQQLSCSGTLTRG